MTNYIIVPYRNRKEHWERFVEHYTKLLPDAIIMRIEQENDLQFNRGWLLNVGAHIAMHKQGQKYFTFHDVDMLAVGNIKEAYSYPEDPTHLATRCSQFGYRMPYPTYFGGVTLFNEQDFVLVNGFSNSYQGWGCEDDDLFLRCKKAGLKVKGKMVRYESLSHESNAGHSNYQNNFKTLQNGTHDGLTDLSYKQLDSFRAGNVYCYKVTI